MDRPAVFAPATTVATCLTCGETKTVASLSETCPCGVVTWETTRKYVPFEEEDE